MYVSICDGQWDNVWCVAVRDWKANNSSICGGVEWEGYMLFFYDKEICRIAHSWERLQ